MIDLHCDTISVLYEKPACGSLAKNCIHVDFGQYPLQCFVAIRILQRGNKIKVVDFFAIGLNAGKRD